MTDNLLMDFKEKITNEPVQEMVMYDFRKFYHEFLIDYKILPIMLQITNYAC